MEPQAVAIRFDPLDKAPQGLKGRRPIIVVARQGLTGAAKNPVPVLNDGAVGGVALKELAMPPSADRAALGPTEKFSLDHLIFIVDRSSSMRSPAFPGAGESKFEHVKELVGNLGRDFFPSTRISLVALSERSELILEDCGRRGTRTRAAVAALSHDRGSNFDKSLQQAVNLFSEGPLNSRKAAVFLTDGWNTGVRERALELARKFRGQNVAVYCVCVGAGYDLPYMLDLTAELGFSGWAHTPSPGGQNNVGKGIKTFFDELQTAEHYLKISGLETGVNSYGVTPAIKQTAKGVYFVGYQNCGVGVCFANGSESEPKLKLETLAYEADPHGITRDIPILNEKEAAPQFEDLQLARRKLGALLVFLAQLEGNQELLQNLQTKFPELGEQISVLLSNPADAEDDRTVNASRDALSEVSNSAGFSQVNALSRVPHPKASQDVGTAAEPLELHSGGVGPLSLNPPSFIPPIRRADPEAYRNLVPNSRPKLVFLVSGVRNELDLSQIPINGVLVIGRADSCDLKIEDRLISRQHFHLTRKTDGFFVEDLGSENGTFVNEIRIQAEQKLNKGDQIRAGGTNFTFAY